MEKEKIETPTCESEVLKCEEKETNAATSNDKKVLSQSKKNVRAIPDSLLKGTKASTARSSTQKPPKGNRFSKTNSR